MIEGEEGGREGGRGEGGVYATNYFNQITQGWTESQTLYTLDSFQIIYILENNQADLHASRKKKNHPPPHSSPPRPPLPSPPTSGGADVSPAAAARWLRQTRHCRSKKHTSLGGSRGRQGGRRRQEEGGGEEGGGREGGEGERTLPNSVEVNVLMDGSTIRCKDNSSISTPVFK